MKYTTIFIVLIGLGLMAACEPPTNPVGQNGNTTNINSANTNSMNMNSAATQKLSEVDRPQKITDMMKERGAQDEAKPTLQFVEPKEGATVNSSTVKIKLSLGGDLKGYEPGKNPATDMGNHIHVILDNQPYEAYYDFSKEFVLENVSDGEHTLRVFPSRPWHESYKNDGAFQMISFTVKNGGADSTKPTTANSNQKMADGKEMKPSTVSAVDAKKPLLTYSRPKGEYKGADADAIMVDFWLANAKLTGDGGEYKVRLSVDGKEVKMIEKWSPIWFNGWSNGKHDVKLELVDKDGKLVENGDYNSTTREITISK